MQIVELSKQDATNRYINRLIELESLFGIDAFSSQDLINEILNNTNDIIAIIVNNKIVSYAATQTCQQRSNTQYIWQMITDPKYRRKGYAALILKHLMNKGSQLSLHVRQDNHPALEMYTALGFKIDHTIEGMYKDGTNGLYLIR